MNIGDKLDTEAFGPVLIINIFRSTTNPDLLLYAVELEDGSIYNATESELTTDE